MALVAYDDSDISEDECEENTDETVLIQQIQNNVINDSEQRGTGGPTLKLPPPKSNQNVENGIHLCIYAYWNISIKLLVFQKLS